MVNSIDWRSQIKKNQRRTTVVVLLYITIYLLLGLLIDLYIYSESYPFASLETIFLELMTLHLMPTATLITVGVALFSLLITYKFYDKIMLLGTSYHQILPDTARSLVEKQLYNVIEELKIAAGLNYMPRVFLIEADYMNAFASGYSEKTAMVAITRGLLEKLDRNELQAVMAHELSHIRHGDIKLTMTAAVLSNILLIVIDILFYNVVYGRNKKTDQRLLIFIIILRYLLPVVTLLLTLYLSRTREYMADAGCVELTRDNIPLAHALMKIHNDYQANAESYAQSKHENVRRSAYLFDPSQAGIGGFSFLTTLFSTHPSLEQRLAALGVKKDALR